MITDLESKRNYPIVTEFILRGKKLKISLVFISQSYFKVLIRLQTYKNKCNALFYHKNS